MKLYRFLVPSFALSLVACEADDTPPEEQLPVCGSQSDEGVLVTALTPEDGATRTLRMPAIQVTLSDEVDCATVTQNQAIKLTRADANDAIPISAIDCAGVPTVLSFSPLEPLALVTEYKVVIDGLDANGNAVPACQAAFTTKSKTVHLAKGTGFSLSLDEDGTVWAWGDQLGTAAPTTGAVPSIVLDDGERIAAGDGHALVALKDGSLHSWGDNYRGQLGDGTQENHGLPAQRVELGLPAGVTVVDVAASANHSVIARSDGKVMTWGDNASGQLGDGTLDERSGPFEVPGLSDIVAVAAAQGSSGSGSTGGATFALAADGTLFGWGANTNGQLASEPGDPYADTQSPVEILAGQNIVEIRAYHDNVFARLSDGTLLGWGTLLSGATGAGVCDGSFQSIPGPVRLTAGGDAIDEVVSIAAGRYAGMLVRGDGTVWGWGANVQGMLGDGTLGETVVCNPNFSFDSTRLSPAQCLEVGGAVQVVASLETALVLTGSGEVFGAGDNANNQLGLAPDAELLEGTDDAAIFQRVPGL